MLYLNGEKKEVKEIAELFDISIPKRETRFKRTMEGANWSDDNRRLIFSGINGMYHYTVKDKEGIEYDFAYTTSAASGSGDRKVFPYGSYSFQGHDIPVSPSKKEEFIALYLHPNCGNNYRAESRKMFVLEDKEAEALASVNKQDKLFKALSYVNDPSVSLDVFKLYAKAKGLSNVDHMSKTQIMEYVGSAALNDPTTFLEDIDSRPIQFRGIVMDAIDKGIIGQENHNNKNYWVWKKGSFKGTQIVRFRDGEAREDTLMHAFGNSDNLDEIIKSIRTIASGETLAQKLAVTEALGNTVKLETIPTALKEGVFTKQGKVYKLGNKFFLECDSDDEQGQIAELTQYVTDNESKRKQVEDAIQRKQTVKV